MPKHTHQWATLRTIVASCAARDRVGSPHRDLIVLGAGVAGVQLPMLLRRFGQDPATASSIILTTVTDVVGFFSFLGIAALCAPWLAPGL